MHSTIKNIKILTAYAVVGMAVAVFVPYVAKTVLPIEYFIDFRVLEPVVEDNNVSFIIERNPTSAFGGEYVVDLVLYEKDSKSTAFSNVYRDVIFEPSKQNRHLVKDAFTNVSPGEYYLDMLLTVELGQGVTRIEHHQSKLFEI